MGATSVVNVSETIARLRKESGETQKELADAIGVSNKVISKWEKSESEPASPVEESAAVKNPAAKRSESPGRNGQTTTPVSMKIIRKIKAYACVTPIAIQPAIAERGSLHNLTIKSIKPMSSLNDRNR